MTDNNSSKFNRPASSVFSGVKPPVRSPREEDLKIINDKLTQDNALLCKEVEKLTSELEKIKQFIEQSSNLTTLYNTLSADFAAFRKRNSGIEKNSKDTAVCDLALKFIPVYDNLNRAMGSIKDAAAKSGVEMICNQFRDVFSQLGITEINSKDELFDPKYHSAVMMVDNTDPEKSGYVSDVYSAGFKFKEKVLKLAQVTVFK